jgi:hypothetical protein
VHLLQGGQPAHERLQLAHLAGAGVHAEGCWVAVKRASNSASMPSVLLRVSWARA